MKNPKKSHYYEAIFSIFPGYLSDLVECFETFPNTRSITFPDTLKTLTLLWAFRPHTPEKIPRRPRRAPRRRFHSPSLRVRTENFSLKTKNHQNLAINNPNKGTAYGLPWLSYAGGLGDGSPLVIIPQILYLFMWVSTESFEARLLDT
jgi:hypothetical protein